jgi:secernin
MCDSWVVISDATVDGNVMMGKNSDRPIFDCQPLVFYPGKKWPTGSKVKLEYIELPQVEAAYATMGAGPYWCWGYEEGINEYSLVIGNEAVFTKTSRELAESCKAGKKSRIRPFRNGSRSACIGEKHDCSSSCGNYGKPD